MPSRGSRSPSIILVVEDYADSREMLKHLLESLNYGVLTAADGSEALALAAGNHIDLVLTDFWLPDMNGITVVRRLRSLSEHWKQIPIIIVTALDLDQESYDEAIEAGCAGVLRKPIDFDKLQRMIRDRLREYDAESTPCRCSE